MAFDREQMKAAAAALAARGIYVGGSSWKYAGWRGQLYDESRYVWKGRLSEARFEKLCLTEYAEVFKSVCVDAAYYKFPTTSYLREMVSQVPADFQFALKVTDEITIKRFPNLPRFGPRAGEANESFLKADLFASEFLGPCEAVRANIGLLMFEFSRFSREDYEHGRDFVAALDEFLGRLPKGWRYGVEIRNQKFLHPDYFTMLARHGVAHVFNSWTAMPPIEEQLAMSGSLTAPDFLGARFLLRPGRGYEAAVKAFSPYQAVKDLYPEGRAAGAQLIRNASATGRKAFVYVNNRFEGNALETIAAMIDQAEQK
jgi:uncharacterized protein YecE (DUF72 family)